MAIGVLLSGAPRAHAQTVVLPVGGGTSVVNGVSADGTAIVGYNRPGSGIRPFRWNTGDPAAGTDLGTFVGDSEGQAYALSGDGFIVAGQSGNFLTTRPFRWDNFVGVTLLGGTGRGAGRGISRDGAVLVGDLGDHAALWVGASGSSPGAVQDLGVEPGRDLSYALGISDDYSKVVGYSTYSGGEGFNHAFVWIVQVGLMPLPRLPVGDSSTATAITGDGTTIVGSSGFSWFEGGQGEAVRWVNGAVQGLGHLPGDVGAIANAVNGDGSVIVGTSTTGGIGGTGRAFIWTQATGMRSLGTYFAPSSLNVPWTPTTAVGISRDGRVIVGNNSLSSGPGWVLTVAPPAPFAILGPESGSTVGARPVLRWTPCSGAATYTVTLIPNPPSGTPTVLTTQLTSITVPAGLLQTCQSVAWSVRATNYLGSTSATPELATFTVVPGDFNADGAVAVTDIFSFLTAWFAGNPEADINGNGLSVQDIFEFLALWFAGCP